MSSAPALAYIALGSNLDDPLHQVTSAIDHLNELPTTQVLKVSRWYRSAPVGPGAQPDYINGVALIATRLPPLALLHGLQAIENRHGRVRTLRWGARTLDLDMLLYGNQTLTTPELTIPHPQMTARNFVLLPLADVAPTLVLPDGTALADLLANLSTAGIVALADC